MARRASTKGPDFVRYFGPVLDALKQLGSSGTPSEVREQVAIALKLSDEILSETIPSGQSRFDNKVNWARFYLAKEGLIDGSVRGVWRLTDNGKITTLSQQQALEIFHRQHETLKSDAVTTNVEIDEDSSDDEDRSAPEPDISTLHREPVAELLRGMTPRGFEEFSALLLRTAGFTEVNVTGRTNDGGIDGFGYLRINPMMTLRVLFQCKRYKDASVSKDDIMKFQTAVLRERAQKGIFVTTSYFTKPAKQEASSGVCEIELIDLDRLIGLMESMNLGLRERKAYSIDLDLFKTFSPNLNPRK